MAPQAMLRAMNPKSAAHDADGTDLFAFQMPSPLGDLCGVASPLGLCQLTFAPLAEALSGYPSPLRQQLFESAITVPDGGQAMPSHLPLRPLGGWLKTLARYLHGESLRLDIPVDLRLARSPFHRAVYESLLQVGPGQTTSYGDLARIVGRPKAARAVGQAVGRNPVALVIPCHRVLGRDGSLHGFAFGLEKKAALLRLEGVKSKMPQASLTLGS